MLVQSERQTKDWKRSDNSFVTQIMWTSNASQTRSKAWALLASKNDNNIKKSCDSRVEEMRRNPLN